LIDFGKVWQAMVFINIAILMANFTGIFPEKWSPYLKGIEEAYNDIQKEMKNISAQDPTQMLINPGSWGWSLFTGILLVIQVALLAPYYVSVTLNNIFVSLGLPDGLGYCFMVINYLSFVFWVIDVIRGRVINVGEY